MTSHIPGPLPTRHRTSSPAACFALILVARVLLRTVGFQRTFRTATRRAPLSPAARIADRELAEAQAHQVAVAAAFYPGRARCLEQSLVLYYLLRRCGQPAELRIGVQPYRFRAHAWVEIDGCPINERGDTTRGLAVMPLMRT